MASPPAGAPRPLGLGRLALRQLRSRSTLAVAQGLTLAAAATLVASVVLIQNQATDNGLRSSLLGAGQGANVLVERDGISQPAVYDTFQRDAAARVRATLGPAVIPGAQFARSTAQMVRTIDGVSQGPPFTWNPAAVYYAELRDHVRVVTGTWPADAASGADWPITMSARATDDLGTPLHVHVGQEYCFSPAFARGSDRPQWCGRIAATWLADDVSDPYWAGHVPETDVATGHDSYFHILGHNSGSAEQQYVPNPSHITASDTGIVVAAVNQLRGYYSVSSNDVFVSGLDTTVSAFVTRQGAASGPTLVSAFGLLVVAVAAMGFAALQFIQGHLAQAALWRARGWSRARVWRLFTLELGALALLAAPLAIVVAALIASLVGGSTATHPGFGWQAIADAAVPALIALAAFLAILAALAGIQSGPELERRRDRTATRGRSRQRRALDLALGAAGIGLLLLVRLGAPDPTAGQGGGLILAVPILAVALLAIASLRLVGVAARVLTVTRSLGGRLARWQLERDPSQYSRLCLLVTLAVAVGVFASTYTASDRASALDRADYMVGADVRATFSSAASPPQLTALSASLPTDVSTAQVFRGAGRPGRSGNDSTILGIGGRELWDIAYSRGDFASPSLPALTSTMTGADPDGTAVPGRPRALTVSVYSSGLDARLELEITDASGRSATLALGALGSAGWRDLTAPLSDARSRVTYPIRVRALRIVPTGGAAGDVAVQDLRTDSGTVLERFTSADGWWQEAFAPDTAEAALAPTLLHPRNGLPSVDVAVDLQTVILQPPPSSHPLPVLLASQTMAALGLSLGQRFPVHIDTVNVQLVAVGSFDLFPTYYPARESLIVVPLTSFLGRVGNQGGTAPWANELWLRVPGQSAAAVNGRLLADSTLLHSFLRSDAEAAALSDPLRVGLHDELGLGFIIALAVVVIGFGLHFLAAARNRATQFAIMRANGVPEAMLQRSLVAEQIVVLLSGLVSGTVIGLSVAWAVLPIFNLGTLPEDVTPVSVFHLDPLTLVAVVLGTGAVALLVGWLVARTGSRVDVMSTVRSLA
ncbi:MAG: FtsX-like permease family protein [Candidatus Dormibacteria bacterium]